MARIKIPFKTIGVLGVVLAGIIFLSNTIGINDNGYRTVVQWPTGKTFVKFEPGIFFQNFGKATVWPNEMSYEIDGKGFQVRYQDGGKGSVDGTMIVSLPDNESQMLEVHRVYRSVAGLQDRLLTPELKQALNSTAGLMTSEEAYAVKRNDYREYALDQINEGLFMTELVSKEVTALDGSEEEKEVPIIRMDPETGRAMHNEPVLSKYGLSIASFQITDWAFAPETEQQINNKRQAEMAIIEAEAKAQQAKSEQQQVIAEGEKAVERVRYEQLQIKERAVIEAQREREVATIKANQQVQVNSEALAAAEIDVETAKQEKVAKQERADGEAYAKQVVLEADGALAQKLETLEKINAVWAMAYSKRNVPTYVSGGSTDVAADNSAQQFMEILTVKGMKDLSTDLSVK
jgi:hypothetical protein